MLSLKKLSYGVTRHNLDYLFNYKTIHRINLRLSQREFRNARENLKIDETGNVKLNLDPEIEAVVDKLKYSDYIESKKLKYGYKINQKIEQEMKATAYKEKLNRHMNETVFSSALKYIISPDKQHENDNNNKQLENNNINKNEDIIQTESPKNNSIIHMPYASTDSYKNTDDNKNKNTPNLDNTLYGNLNQDYKKLYDKYLEAKKLSNINNISTKQYENIENLESQILKMEINRPNDDLSKVPKDWMTDYEQYNEDYSDISWEKNYGTQNINIPVSKIPCGGCGALLHCQDSAIPGYLPSELFIDVSENELKSIICQRCHFMKHYNATLEVKVSPDVYPEILSKIELQKKKAAVILMIDLTDFPCSIWPNLPTIIGKNTNIFVVGNKIDLLPRDGPRFLENVENSLLKALENAGIRKFNIKNISLVSAKSGYGIERLINKLYKIWEYKGDVYMIGCTNVGKSTLFNAFLRSDYCKIQAVDLIQRATTSPWPGTTLNLLKFPIMNPARWRLFQRVTRLKGESKDAQAEIEFNRRQVTSTGDITFATLQERIGQTFSPVSTLRGPSLQAHEIRMATGNKFGIDEDDDAFKFGKWCYDTPGVIHPDQIVHLLTTEELLLTLPRKIISPKSFIFQPGQTLFIGGLGRLDFIEGFEFIRITVFKSDSLPITICSTNDADMIYDKLLKTEAFVVPVNNPDRLKIWPKFESKDFTMTGITKHKSVSDIILSNAGWISITPDQGETITLRAWTPEGRGIYERTPALLPHSITLRGARRKSSPAYKRGPQVYNKT